MKAGAWNSICLLCGWLGPKYLRHNLLSPIICQQKVGLEPEELELEPAALIWGRGFLNGDLSIVLNACPDS